MKKKPRIAAGTRLRRDPTPARVRKSAEQADTLPMLAELYRRAETRLRARPKSPKSQSGLAESEADYQKLLHELQVHRVELELQNAELKEARDRMEDSLEQYTDLYDFAPVGYFTLTADGTIRRVNLTGAHLVGIERARLIGQPFQRLVAPEVRSALQAFLNRVFVDRTKQTGDFGLLGKVRPFRTVNVEARLSPLGRECHVVAMDITERKQAEEELRCNEALFSALIEQAPYGVYVVDAHLRLQQVNRKARPVFRKVCPLIGRELSAALHILWPRRVADQIVARFQHTLATGEPYQSPEFTERRRDIGVQEYYEWQVQRVTLPAGEPGVVCYFNDVSERKRTEEARRRIAILDASNQKLEKEIAQRKAVEQSLKQSERHQHRLLGKSRQMQQQLRQLSRQLLRAQEEERKTISRELHDVIAQSLTGITVRLAALRKQAAQSPRGLARSLAITHQLAEESVTIVKRNGTVRMRIKDNGKGFNRKLSAPHVSTKRLGLLGMRERVEMIHGELTINSAPGKGTTIEVQIPISNRPGGRSQISLAQFGNLGA